MSGALREAAAELRQVGGYARWALGAIWRTRRSLVFGLGLLVLARGLPPAGLAIAARGLIDAIVGGHAAGVADLRALAPWLALALLSMLGEALSPLGTQHLAARLQDEVGLAYTVDVLEQAGRLEPSLFEEGDGRDRFERARVGASTALALFVNDLQTAASGLVQTVSLVAILGVIEPLVLLLMPPVALPYLFVQYRLARGRYQEERSRTRRRRHTRHLAEQLTGEASLAEVRLLGLPALLVRRYRETLEGFLADDRRHRRRRLRAGLSFGTLTSLAFFALFARVAWRALVGGATLGELAVFGGAAGRLRFALDNTIVAGSGMLERALYIGDLRDFLQLEARAAPARAAAPSALERVELRALGYRYPGAERAALEDVSFELRRGEIVALVGENGAGKSTVARLLAGVLTPGSGAILFDGVDLRELDVDTISRHVALLPQVPARFEATALENIAFGDWRRLLGAPEEVERIARRTGAGELLRSLPAGGDTRLGRIDGEHELSGGQWQLLGLARAYAHGGSLLVLDEPSSNLDPRAERLLFGRLREIGRERATLLITHRPTAVALADRVVVLDGGRVVEDGTHAELLARGGLYAQLYALGEHGPVRVAP